MQSDGQKHKYYMKAQNANSFWNFMHTLAAYYPEKPSEKEQRKMRFFVENCGEYFLSEPKWGKRYRKNVNSVPPKLESRNSFILWMCEQHNIVNESIGKSVMPCILPDLIKRWGPVTLPDTKASEIS